MPYHASSSAAPAADTVPGAADIETDTDTDTVACDPYYNLV